MFADLVGSTALGARLDPEDLREVIAAYQGCVSGLVAKGGGFIALLGSSLAKAREQGAKLWELRAARDLAELMDRQGKRAAACELLAPVYGWFTVGLGSPDLIAAQRLLAEMGDKTFSPAQRSENQRGI
jgi:class 3 adenylate cyclase